MTATAETLRKTAAIALTAAEAEAIARANAALSWIAALDFPWPADSGLLKMYADCLRDSLADYAALTTGNSHPASLFPDLGHGQDNAMETALDRVTQDITDWTREVVVLGNRAEEARAREEAALAALEAGEAA